MALKLDIVGSPLKPHTFTYDDRDVMLYALGIGAGPDELDYIFEGRGPKVFPTFAVVPGFLPMMDAIIEINANLLQVLHGEQEVVIHAPFPSSGTVSTQATVEHVWDKGKGALAVIVSETHSADGTLLAQNRASIFCRGEGGFGGEPGPKATRPTPPEGVESTFSEKQTTLPQQALLYRLSGDRNPLHADPGFAKMAGFDRPILHGLCTFGHMARALVKNEAGGDASRLKRISARFTDVVLPGETLTTEGWKTEGDHYVLRVTTSGGATAIGSAEATL